MTTENFTETPRFKKALKVYRERGRVMDEKCKEFKEAERLYFDAETELLEADKERNQEVK